MMSFFFSLFCMLATFNVKLSLRVFCFNRGNHRQNLLLFAVHVRNRTTNGGETFWAQQEKLLIEFPSDASHRQKKFHETEKLGRFLCSIFFFVVSLVDLYWQTALVFWGREKQIARKQKTNSEKSIHQHSARWQEKRRVIWRLHESRSLVRRTWIKI